MSRAGEVFENPVTGERTVVRLGTDETKGELLVVDLYVRPGGAVAGEHIHPAITESFTVVRGRVGFRLDGREDIQRQRRRNLLQLALIAQQFDDVIRFTKPPWAVQRLLF